MPDVNRRNLNDEIVKRLRPEPPEDPRPYRVWDTRVPQLFLRVQPSGIKSWNAQISRASSLALGKYPTVTVEMARKQAQANLGHVAKGELPPKLAAKRAKKQARLEGRPETLDQLLDHYQVGPHKKNRNPDDAVKRVRSVYADLLPLPLAKITEDRVAARHTARKREGLAESSIARDFTALHAVFSWAAKRGHIAASPFVELRPDPEAVKGQEIVRYLSPEQRARLFDALAARDREMRAARERTIAGNRKQHADVQHIPADGFADYLEPLVRLALNTACRRGELLKLQWGSVDLEGGYFTVVKQGKGSNKANKQRRVILNDDALDVLRRWKKQTGGHGRVFDIDSPRRAWLALLKRAKIEEFRFHDLRHDAASQLVMNNVDLYTVSKVLGHANVATTQKYAHLSPDHLRAAVGQLDAINSPAPKQGKVVPLRAKARK
jgi:integrase